MSGAHPAPVGSRIAELRKIHGLTQQSMAAWASVSYSLLRMVERGERPASPSFIAAIARALGLVCLAADHLSAARSLAADGQDEANFYGTKFGLPNVSIHEVAVPVELTDGTTAVTRAATVTLPPTTAPSRVGHYWIDLSRAWLLHGDRRQALDSLRHARRIAPQLTRYHPQVHETVHILAMQDARSTTSLRHFAAWCGIRT